jgi:hypothetical protein
VEIGNVIKNVLSTGKSFSSAKNSLASTENMNCKRPRNERLRTKGSLSRDEAIAIVGRNTVEAVGHVKRQFTGAELNKEGLVEFVASIEAVDTDGQSVTVSAYYYQPTDAIGDSEDDLADLDWKISGHEVYA